MEAPGDGPGPGRVQVDLRPDEPADPLLRRAVAAFLGIASPRVRVGRLCPRCGSADHGQPVVTVVGGGPAVWVGLSRADGQVMTAVGDCGPLGVDLESVSAAVPADVVLHPGERAPDTLARLRTWVRKESLLKATGDGLTIDPRRVRLTDADQAPRLIEWPRPGSSPQLWMRDLVVDGYVACVSVLTTTTPLLSLRSAAPAARER